MNIFEERTEGMEELPDKREYYGEQYSKHDMSIVLRNSHQPVIVHEGLLKISLPTFCFESGRSSQGPTPPQGAIGC